MKTLAVLAAVMLCGCASFKPPENWTKADTRRQIAYSSILALDAATTARMHERPGLKEGSSMARIFIGKHPEPTEVYVASALLGVAHYWLMRRMKPERRRILQWFTIAAHAQAVRQNCNNQLC